MDRELPVIALRTQVVLPRTLENVDVGRPKSKRALEEAQAADNRVLLVVQREPRVDDPGPEDLFDVGTLCVVKQVIRLPDDTLQVLVEGRDYTNSWAYIHPTGLERGCWVALSAVVLSGDIRAVGLVVPNLYPSDEVPVPGGVTAERNGGKVTFSWNAVANAPEVGYLLEVIQCLNGFAINASYATDNTSITLNDGTDCSVKSEGTLRSKNKLGYSRSVELPWP